jgi:phosphoglycolate phosphatase-like HAD superfamily hydrolase
MHSLRDLIRNFGCVPESEIKSAEEYKRIYLEELHRMIDRRAEEVRRGMLTSDDVTLKGAPRMLEALRGRGVSLFLASGSDHDAVEAEAELLGYAHLFDGGIFGSVGDAENDPKTVVLEQILNTIGDERAERVVTFGDGPVEIRETKRRGGTAVGVASDEVRRHGLNVEKRKRLILADADLIIPDFAEHDAVLGALFGA